jgi:hypothetical protein
MTAEEYLRALYGAYRGHYEWRALEEAFNAGAAAEREACAVLVEQMGMEEYGTLAIAAAIRERGKK